MRRPRDRTRVLLTGDRTRATLAAVRGLAAGGYEPCLAHWQDDTYATRSRRVATRVRVPDPSDDPKGFRALVARSAADLGVAAVLPGGDSSLIALAGAAADFPSCKLAAPAGAAALERAIDKSRLAALAAQAGLTTPPTRIFTTDALRCGADALVYPLVLKPAQSVVLHADGTLERIFSSRIESARDLRRHLAAGPAEGHVVQPYVEGELTAVCGVAWEGELVCSLHQRARRIWPPDCGTSADAVSVPPDPELEAGARAVCRLVEWSGILQLQFLRARDAVYLIDLNPRIYGSLGLALAAGLNLPAIWTDLVLDRPPRAPLAYRVGIRWRAEEAELFGLHRALRERRLRDLPAFLPRPRTAYGAFALDDPGPALIAARNVRRALSRRRLRNVPTSVLP